MPGRLPCPALVLLALCVPHAALGARFKVSLLTMSPGSSPFERFGHTALAIEDHETGHEQAYNFGTFDEKDPDLWYKALHRKLPYWVSTMNPGVTAMRYAEREIRIQELALDDVQAAALLARLEVQVRPENRVSRYDPFTDNCVTRVRDLLDEVCGGALRRHTQGPAPRTYRQEVMQALLPIPLIAAGVTLIYGPYTDLPRSRWELLFLPRTLHDALGEITIGEGTERRSLVKGERVFRGPAFTPPESWPTPLLLPLLLALALGYGMSALLRARVRQGRSVIGWAGALISLGSGALGVGLFYLGLTPFAFFAHDANRFLINPLDLATVPFFVLLGLGKLDRFGERVLLWLLAAAALLGVLHLLGAHVLGSCPQAHGAVLAWVLGGRVALLLVTLLAIRKRQAGRL